MFTPVIRATLHFARVEINSVLDMRFGAAPRVEAQKVEPRARLVKGVLAGIEYCATDVLQVARDEINESLHEGLRGRGASLRW